MATENFANAPAFSEIAGASEANDTISLNRQIISNNYTFPAGHNGVSAGPITIADGVTVTITTGCEWSIV